MTKQIIVDENDNIIAFKSREEFSPSDINRSSVLWLTNNQGEILIAQRSAAKKRNPEKWGYAVSGVVEEDETYESNVIKETKEELGLSNLPLIIGPKMFIEVDRPFFVQIYFCQKDIKVVDCKLQESEVKDVQWIKKNDLISDVKTNPDKYLLSMPIIMATIYPEFKYL